MCMLTRSLLLALSSLGVGRADCRSLYYNAITELAATLFDKLTNLEFLYVTLDACMPLPPLDAVAVRGAGRPWEVVLEGAPYSCSVWGVGSCSLASSDEGWGRVCFWAEAGVCMLTRTLLFEPSSSGVGRADCRWLDGNVITDLAPTLFEKLTNLRFLYVTLDAVMHAPFSS